MYSIGEVAKAIGVAPYQNKYRLEKGILKEPRRLNGRRCFTAAEREAIRRHFTRKRVPR